MANIETDRKSRSKRRDKWTASEDVLIGDLARFLTPVEIADRIQRTVPVLNRRLKHIGVNPAIHYHHETRIESLGDTEFYNRANQDWLAKMGFLVREEPSVGLESRYTSPRPTTDLGAHILSVLGNEHQMGYLVQLPDIATAVCRGVEYSLAVNPLQYHIRNIRSQLGPPDFFKATESGLGYAVGITDFSLTFAQANLICKLRDKGSVLLDELAYDLCGQYGFIARRSVLRTRKHVSTHPLHGKKFKLIERNSKADSSLELVDLSNRDV